MKQSGKYKVVDLFAGAGGMTLGFHMAGFESKLAVDFDKDSCETYRKNFKNTNVICGDIRKVDNKTILKLTGEMVDVIIGGPPCQGFGLEVIADVKACVVHGHFSIASGEMGD